MDIINILHRAEGVWPYYKILKDRSCEVRRNNKIIKFLRQTCPIKEEDIQELINIIQEIEW